MAVLAMLGVLFSADLVRRYGPRVSTGAMFAMACETPVVALTIDDSPDPATTPDILATLARHGATATFFVVGERALEHPATLAAIAAQGSELGNHTFTAAHADDVSAGALVRGVTKTHHLLSGFGHVRWLRPGGGRVTPAVREVADAHGYGIALANVYPLDHALPWPAAHAAYVTWSVDPGAIIALHDDAARGARTVETLKTVLPSLAADGYRVVSLSEMAQTDGCW